MSVVLEVQPDTSYEPSEAEMVEYGKWLGMELPEDMPLLWIAREGLKAPLPDNWKACKSEKGELYYFNFKTGQSIWDHPSDEHYRELFKTEKAKLQTKDNGKGGKSGPPAAASRSPAAQSGKAAKRKKSVGGDAESGSTSAPPQEATSKAAAPAKELQPIQAKRELPGPLKLTPVASEGGKNNRPNAAARRLSSPEFQSATSQTDSSQTSDAAKAPKIDEPDAIPLPTRVVAGGGVNGLRALDKLGAPATESAVTPRAKEQKAKLEQQTAKELEEYKAQRQSSLQRKKDELDTEIAEDLKQHQERANTERQKRRASVDKETADALKAESARLGAELDGKLASLRQEYEAKRAAESERLRNKLKAQLDHDKRKVEAEVAQMLEAFTREKRQESEIKKEAQSQALLEVSKGITDVKQYASSFVREYETALSDFVQAVSSSKSAVDQIGARKQRELQEALDAKLNDMRQENARQLQQEQEHFDCKLSALRKDLEREAAELKQTHEQQLQKSKDEFVEQRSADQKEQLSQEHERFMTALAEIKASQAKELETLKEHLKEKAQEELNAVMQELAREKESRRNSLSAARFVETHEAARVGLSRSVSATDDEDDVEPGKTSPPRLDRKLLAGPLMDDNVVSSPVMPAQPDIKALVTEALREMFAGSPFILPSPGQAQETAAPAPEAHAAAAAASTVTPSRAAQEPRPVVGLVSATPPPLSGNATRVPNAFALPLSFQEQRSLVDGERRRLQEGRRYVEQQQLNLEERRQQLKRTRHQWKQDVLAAKREGVRSSSKRGQLLNKVRFNLEEQAQGLEHDMMILRDSQVWLLSKEQRLMILERQIEEQERLRSRNGGEASALNNCSVDTAALMTGYFKPQRHSSTGQDLRFHRDAVPYNGAGGSGVLASDGYATSPILSKALSRIERRLDEVTSIIHMQHQQAASQALTPSHGHGGSGRRLSTVSLAARDAAQGFTRRVSRSHSKQDILRRESHLDQWQGPGM